MTPGFMPTRLWQVSDERLRAALQHLRSACLAEPALPEAPLRRSLPRLRQLADSGFLHGNSGFKLALATARSLVLDALLLGRDRRVWPF